MQGRVPEFFQGQGRFGHGGVGQAREQVADQGQAPAPLVVEVHQRPWCVLAVGGGQHHFAGLGVFGVFLACLQVHRRQLPALERVGQALGKAFLLLLLVYRQPILEQQDAIVHQQLFEDRRLLQEGSVLFGRAVAHDLLHPGAVVPAAVHQQQFAGRRQVRDVALEVPLGGFAVTGLGQGQHLALAWVDVAADGVDAAALAGGVAALEDHHQALAGAGQPACHRHQLQLQWFQPGFIVLALEFLAHLGSLEAGRRRRWRVAAMPRATSISAPCWRGLRPR